MATTAPSIVDKVWNYAHLLQDDGVSYGDYVEQITYLLFLKWADTSLVRSYCANHAKVARAMEIRPLAGLLCYRAIARRS